MKESPKQETFRDTERKLREKIVLLESQLQPLDKYNSELTTFKNKTFISGFKWGFISGLCILFIVLKAVI